VVDWLRKITPGVRRFGSVCSGAFFLAATGLLNGRRITTHWAVADRLAQAFPSINIDADAIHVRDGRLRTAAGVTAGLDLALTLVEEDLGRDVAMRVAAQLVMFFKRPGGQMQFSRKGETALVGRSALQEAQRWIVSNPAADHSVARLAQRMGLSPRHFARLFRQEVGITPATWVEEARVTAARRLLESGGAPKQAAAQCGFADSDTLRRAFVRVVGITPAEYRKRYSGRSD
jgi:transcriptional regulator GlxA family with amidase domain